MRIDKKTLIKMSYETNNEQFAYLIVFELCMFFTW